MVRTRKNKLRILVKTFNSLLHLYLLVMKRPLGWITLFLLSNRPHIRSFFPQRKTDDDGIMRIVLL